MSNILKVRKLPRSFVVNNVHINGRLGQNPERKEFDSGTVKYKGSCAFGFSTDKDRQTMWLTYEAWSNIGAYGEKGVGSIIGNYLSKGQMMEAGGQLQTQTWTDKSTGELRSAAIIKVVSVRLVEKKATAQPTNPAPAAAINQEIKEKF